MKTIRIKKGYNLKVVGSPSTQTQKIGQPTGLALLPEHIPFVKPRLKVAKDDWVALGSPLFEDKRNPNIQFLSPGGGRVADIRFGPRRVIQEIIIQLEDTEKKIEFRRYSQDDVDKMSREQLAQAIIAGGLWSLIKELPFRDYARPDVLPPVLYVSLDSLEPFHPAPQVYLAGNEALFRFGLSILGKLAEAPVHVCRHLANSELSSSLNGLINLIYTGNYPAHDPGVLLYRMKSSPKENRAWYINGQDVLLIARLMRDGVYPTERIVSLGGSGVPQPGHVIARMGAPLSFIAAEQAEELQYRGVEPSQLRLLVERTCQFDAELRSHEQTENELIERSFDLS